MSNNRSYESDVSVFDLLFGLSVGLAVGSLAGILFAPKPGKELQDDVQGFINQLPDKFNSNLEVSKTRYKDIVGKTKDRIENELEQRSHRRQASQLAEAKRREELETGSYDY